MSIDNTIDQFEVSEYKGGYEVLDDISKFLESGFIEINKGNCGDLRFIFERLNNCEMLNKLDKFQYGDEDLSVCNCIERLKWKENRGNCDAELEFIASHFYMFDSSELEQLKSFGVNLLESILSSENLLLKDEDSLVDFISSLGGEFSTLYNYVHCRFLTLTGINKFISSISSEEINSCIWGSVCRRLQYEVCDWNLHDKRFAEMRIGEAFPFEGNEWDGILSHLAKDCDGNVHEKGIVNITASSEGSGKCWQVTNHGWSGYWYSANVPDSWICFDFIEKSVSLRYYTLKSHNGMRNWFTQWEIEGSNDGNDWESLDSRNTRDLCGKSIAKSYQCLKVDRIKYFRFIRMRQTGKTNDNEDHLILCNIEFFGIVCPQNSVSS
jgi:hypothetical protein